MEYCMSDGEFNETVGYCKKYVWGVDIPEICIDNRFQQMNLPFSFLP